MNVEPTDLDYPFYAFSFKVPDDIDVSFAYHALFSEKADGPYASAICNDIPCNCCPFTCKEGIDRQAQLLGYARKYYPEHQI